MADTCSAPGCTRPARAKGLCTRDYQRQRRGLPLGPPEPTARLHEVLVTEAMRDAIRAAASAAGLTEAEWRRRAYAAALAVPHPRDTER